MAFDFKKSARAKIYSPHRQILLDKVAKRLLAPLALKLRFSFRRTFFNDEILASPCFQQNARGLPTCIRQRTPHQRAAKHVPPLLRADVILHEEYGLAAWKLPDSKSRQRVVEDLNPAFGAGAGRDGYLVHKPFDNLRHTDHAELKRNSTSAS
jgi:hypothetical protein